MKKIYLILIVLFLLEVVNSQSPQFKILEENVEITIYREGVLEVWYYLRIETTMGPQRGIYLGLPTHEVENFAASSKGQMLKIEKEGERLKIWFLEVAETGDVTEVKVSFFAYGMVHIKEKAEVMFIPTWWDTEVEVLRVKYYLPEGVQISMVGNSPTAQNRGEEGGRAFVYFERHNLSPGERFESGVSFPREYVEITEEGGGIGIFIFFFVVLIFVVIIFAVIFKAIRKAKYESPVMAMESFGANKNLDAVEASVLLEANPLKVINIILLGLVKKGKLRVLEWSPLKVEVVAEKEIEALNCPNCGAPVKVSQEIQYCEYCGTEIRVSRKLSYYENEFLLKGVKGGKLDVKGLRIVLKNLANRVNEKMRGYHRGKTKEYYEKKIQEIWGDLKNVSDEEKYRLFGDDVEWLLLDDEFDKKTENVFEEVSRKPVPSWFIWYNLPKGEMDGKEFSKSLSKRSNFKGKGIKVRTLKDALTTPVSVSHSHKSCVCACVSCACACACVSCACACASGGGF